MEVLAFGTDVNESGELVNKYVPPVPSYNSLSQSSSSLVNSARTAGGAVIGTRVGKRNLSKLSLSWSVLTASQWASIQEAIRGATDSNILFYVRYFDMERNAFIIRRMYAGDRSAQPLKLDKETGAVTLWQDCTVNLVDAGNNMSNPDA